MAQDHPPVDILRLGARGTAVAGLIAGAAQLYTAFPAAVLAVDPVLLLWVPLVGLLVSASVVALLLPRFELYAGVTLVLGATLASILGGGVAIASILGWAHVYALLLFAAGVFFLSAWRWELREVALQSARRTLVDDPEPANEA